MALGGKAWTEGSSVFMAFRPRVLRFHGFSSHGHPSVPFDLTLPVSETDGAETDVPEKWKAARDGCPRDGGRPPETDVAEWMSPRRKV